MCGIAGYVGARREPVPVILDGLARLEYRGYDSAGLAVLGSDEIAVHKIVGRVSALAATTPDFGNIEVAIGHTRWATHGEPTLVNAHPHLDAAGRFAIVHNGIIENAAELRTALTADGFVFASSTDTEVLVHLMAAAGTEDLCEALAFALSVVEGTYGIAAISVDAPGQIALARNGSPVLIGIGDGEHFVASDASAFARYTQRVIYLEDQEIALVDAHGFNTQGLSSHSTPKTVTTLSWAPDSYEIGEHEHFMSKEIHEQPAAIERLVSKHVDGHLATVDLGELRISTEDANRIRRVCFIGCGSAYYTGLAGVHLIEQLAGIPAEAAPASEFRYRRPFIDPDTLYIALSQSGETLDTLQAVWEIQRQGGRVIGVVNAPDSSLARACDDHLPILAGPEISVTSTKSFESTLVALTLIALDLGMKRSLSRETSAEVIAGLVQLPSQLEVVLNNEEAITSLANRVAGAKSTFFVGRLTGFPIALEGSQKLKEVTYIHAEAYPCGELKHGPLALVAPDLPTVAIVPDDELLAKNLGTLSEIRARRGPILAIGHSEELKSVADDVVLVPKLHPVLDPLLLLVPLQILAYQTALVLGRDIDKPRNLAKSVTVE